MKVSPVQMGCRKSESLKRREASIQRPTGQEDDLRGRRLPVLTGYDTAKRDSADSYPNSARNPRRPSAAEKPSETPQHKNSLE